MSAKQQPNKAKERIKQAAWAGLIAIAVLFSGVVAPIDQLTWTLQARIVSFDASGQYAFVGSETDLTDPSAPERRIKLAQTIDRMRDAGAKAIYIDAVFDSPSSPVADTRLNRALRDMDGNGYLVRNLNSTIDGRDKLDRSSKAVRAGIKEVGVDRYRELLGVVWEEPYVVRYNGTALPGLSASMAGKAGPVGAKIPINYGFNIKTIPLYNYRLLTDGKTLPDLKGKTVLIGSNGRADAPSVPGQIDMPASIVNIYAAETLNAGLTNTVLPVLPLLIILILLSMGVKIRNVAIRRIFYIVLCASLPVVFLTTAFYGIRTNGGGPILVLLIYGLFRLRSMWKRNFQLVDSDTGLPTFAALENDRDVAITAPAIIVARIHRFEEVRKSLPKDLHQEYVSRIVDRMNAANPQTAIYLGPGHLIGWCLPEKDPILLKEHLEGLRAMFAAPLQVGPDQVDVSITFGVDVTPSPNIGRRLANAMSAAEHTTETFEPIQIAEVSNEEDMIWNISLQARIDKALSNGEIYLVYQPKILVTTGELVGVESLARWNDPVKGHIPPDHFIRQCENAGRMGQLTRHVLRQACSDGNAFEDRGVIVPVAVNISATMLHERAIVQMVKQVLDETGFDPQRLTLEVTETYRISNLELASEILGELTALGPKISMDDFGVGAASLEALLRLPFSELKIDRMFIAAMQDETKAHAIVRSILKMGKDLRIVVVAEGVENSATLTMLRDAGCLVAQGFGISRPVPFAEILSFSEGKNSFNEKLSI